MLLFVSFIFIDQITKYLVRHWGGFYICNKEIAFGIGLPPAIFWIIWIIILIILISNFKFHPPRRTNKVQLSKSKRFDIWILDFIWNTLDFGFWISKTKTIGLILILAGAISNILDRLYFGCVIDFIKIPFWPLFNLADAFIIIGVIITVWKIKTTD
ncbi:MAG: hypothetical protein COX30_04595 [Candidatus Moranbacteria bacterium CG23_combo_of_CG06-09_8_20_14_all_39_10]|nr:MAG: hypothetical protein COX30_04595 [Candidatus Moranbacteria bacterium CG23_combo_of_CG06-09_8_20_14_all_39_10]